MEETGQKRMEERGHGRSEERGLRSEEQRDGFFGRKKEPKRGQKS